MKLSFNILFPFLAFVLMSSVFSSCGGKTGNNAHTLPLPETISPVRININTGVSYQTIDNFGASDAWSCQFTGQWAVAKREQMADLLFSRETDESGNPKGIGLSLWRFNLGAGSAGQAENSGIKDEWRRAESFLKADGTYDWDRQKGQLWFARAAEERGVENLLLFANSPPVSMTRNGKAYSNSGTQSNLPEHRIGQFARFLANTASGLRKMGLTPTIISPVNEPQWDWTDGGQEGTCYTNSEIAGIVRALDMELDKKGLDLKIDISEAGQINYLFETGNKEGRGKQIAAFFGEGSPDYIGNLSHVSHTISGHSYFTTSPASTLVKQREKLAGELQKYPGLKYWMSEYCILGNNDGDIKGHGRDLGMPPALYMARVIHHDLVIANASAWHWWLAISPYDYKDGLIYVDKNKTDGNIYPGKMLWTLGNYSRFIRPGYKRVHVETGQDHEGLLVSAYRDPKSGKCVVVMVNTEEHGVLAQFSLDGRGWNPGYAYVTSEEENLNKTTGLVMGGGNVEIPGQSVVTFVHTN
ncbi:O-Glycosyl hydrolase [Sinomicrobium oceani]|uniref:O-Glycosyl hydrolase n=1 Tax=Sinomicrobium oceani TaxID=1150368 RepID=A0A1K1QNC0_9FLAO|nr:glycoside hydrolase [Sinomicrobium oceani]SFW60750.1 O-Glycosyl hydrolase [Sinomicrobium oceani]